MTEPTEPTPFNAPRPSGRKIPDEQFSSPIAQAVDDATNNFGPDHTKVPDSDPLKRPKPKGKTPFSLGANKKPRSGVRAMTDKDRDKVAQLYLAAAMGTMPFKPKVSQALATSADDCADAWVELAKENDSVRRILLMLIEGGAWGKLFAAHAPILMALLPDDAFANMFKGFAAPASPEDIGETSD